MALPEEFKLTYGLSKVLIDGVESPHLAEAVNFSAEPVFEDIPLYPAGKFDKVLIDWNVNLTLVVDEDSWEAYNLALPGLAGIDNPMFVTEELTPDERQYDGYRDGKGAQRMRGKSKYITIHPVDFQAPNTSSHKNDMDITIYKAIQVGTFTRSYAYGKTTYEIQFEALHRTGDQTEEGNYFAIGREIYVDEYQNHPNKDDLYV